MVRTLLLAVGLLLIGCAMSPSIGREAAQKTYLPRIVAIDDDDQYPDGFYLSRNPPSTLDRAVDSVLRAIPQVPSTAETPDICKFSSLDEIDAGMKNCRHAACQRLPTTSRERGCGYLIQLGSWIEDAWLGGSCLFKEESRSGPLVNWFRRHGVYECHEMSTVISIAIAQSLIGERQKAAALIRPFLNERLESSGRIEN